MLLFLTYNFMEQESEIVERLQLNKENEIHKERFFAYTDLPVVIRNQETIYEVYKWLSSLHTTINNKRDIFLEYFKKIVNNNHIYKKEEIIEEPALLHKYHISYRKIDRIALNNRWWTLGSSKRHRIILYVCIENICENKGHVYVEWGQIMNEIGDERNGEIYKGINKDLLQELLNNSAYCSKYGILFRKKKITLKKYYDYEINLLENIQNINNIRYPNNKVSQDDFKRFYNDERKLSNEQLKAINYAMKYNICAVTGQGGSGKTSWVVKYLCKYIIEQHISGTPILFLTPTHAAKKRGIEEFEDEDIYDNLEFSTIHSYIHRYKKTSKLEKAILNGCRYIIIDEMSMVDLPIFSTFMKICLQYEDLHIVLLGDNNQLKPVGVGCPFRDLLEYNLIQRVHLTKNFRSDGDIIPFCKTIMDNDTPWTLDKHNPLSLVNQYSNDIDYKFTTTYEETDSKVKELLVKLKDQGYVPYSSNNEGGFQVISYTNGDCINYSKFIRNLFTENQSDETFAVGDPIIVKKNDKDRNIHNGDEGIIRANSEEDDNSYIIDLVNEDIPRKYPLILKKDEIKPAFARTVHSSQGLQFKKVIYVCKGWFNLNKNINYTAYSRAKSKLYLIGNINCFNSEKVREPDIDRNTYIRLRFDKNVT